MNATSAAGLPLEVLDRIRDINIVTIDPGSFKGFIENLAGGTNEWSALQIFLIARLLSDKHYFGTRLSLAEDRLSSTLPQIATFALMDSSAERRKCIALGKKIGCRSDEFSRGHDQDSWDIQMLDGHRMATNRAKTRRF
jgi:hypothetical protein